MMIFYASVIAAAIAGIAILYFRHVYHVGGERAEEAIRLGIRDVFLSEGQDG